MQHPILVPVCTLEGFFLSPLLFSISSSGHLLLDDPQPPHVLVRPSLSRDRKGMDKKVISSVSQHGAGG